ncbi:MAG: hypothetical protein J7521_00660 [Caulobacter sp.]|nr:hypothetical protein [Caulobacter sp.]
MNERALPPLTMAAEPFGPYGGMTGDGAVKLLGKPPLTTLATLVREAGQNAWDARKPGHRVRFVVRLRHLEDDQTAVLRSEVFGQPPLAPASRTAFNEAFSIERPLILEIADFGTVGLGGPIRADDAVSATQSRRFVNFVWNLGSASDVVQGGGTYGFGKSSLFRASFFKTIIVDSLAQDNGSTERRLIACHTGKEFADPSGKRYTGRHWWGVPRGDGLVDPMTGETAAGLASRIGLPERGNGETGTTVGILMPRLETVDEAIAEIREALLWYFWPKMVSVNGAASPMEFALFEDGVNVPIPPPESFPPLDLYVEAFLAVKKETAASRVVKCGNPRMDLGRMAVSKGFRGDRRLPAKETLVHKTTHHVALMRPVELVVRYLPGEPLPIGTHEWAGVFICSAETEVERAFAASEPPAHDDWVPNNLEERRAKTFVNVGLRRIAETANQIIYPKLNQKGSAPDQPPLARTASLLGQMAPLAPDSQAFGSGRPLRGARRRWTVQPARYVSISEVKRAVEAVFQVVAQNGSHEPLRITAKPGLILEDKVSKVVQVPGGGVVTVLGWETPDGVSLAIGDVVEVAAGASADMRVRIRIPGDGGAVGVLLGVED